MQNRFMQTLVIMQKSGYHAKLVFMQQPVLTKLNFLNIFSHTDIIFFYHSAGKIYIYSELFTELYLSLSIFQQAFSHQNFKLSRNKLLSPCNRHIAPNAIPLRNSSSPSRTFHPFGVLSRDARSTIC